MPFQYEEVTVPKEKRLGLDPRIDVRMKGTTVPPWQVELEKSYPDHEYRLTSFEKMRPSRINGKMIGTESDLNFLKKLKSHLPDEEIIHPLATVLDIAENHLHHTRRAAKSRISRLWRRGLMTRYRRVDRGDWRNLRYGTWYQLKSWKLDFFKGTRPLKGVTKSMEDMWRRR